MLPTGTETTTRSQGLPIVLATPSAAAERYLRLRRVILMAEAAAVAAATATSEVCKTAAEVGANGFRMRVDVLAEDVWATPVRSLRDLLERAELTRFYRPAEGIFCPSYNRAVNELVAAIFCAGGRHG